MKRFIVFLLMVFISASLFAQDPEYLYTEASDLTLVGKLMPGKTQNPYHLL